MDLQQMHIGLLSCAKLPEPDHDELPLLTALSALGARAESVLWDGDHGDLSRFDGLVVRATWNYPEAPVAFAAFLERAAASTTLLNPLRTIRQNLHKGYLLALPDAGVPTVPTQLIALGSEVTAGAIPWEDVVVKPAVSCGSYRTRSFTGAELEAAASFATTLARDGDVLLQPVIEGFADPGERALVWIDGEVTHGVLKRPRFQGQDESVAALEQISASDRELAARAIASVEGEPIYARVDVVETDDGAVVSELECIEPSLFFWVRPEAADRLARAILRRVSEPNA